MAGMRCFVLLALAGLATASYSSETKCYAESNQRGEWYEFNEYTPNLAVYHFDNTIESIRQTGMWMYYDNPDYNTDAAGKVFWVSGIDFHGNVPAEYINTASSLRYAGSPLNLNDDSWTVYSGTGFTGRELFGMEDAPTLGHLGDDVSSIIVMGSSGWTFYDATGYGGTNHVCLKPNFVFTDVRDGRQLHVGIYPTPGDFFISDNNIESVRKGCWSKNVMEVGSVRANVTTTHGAWGILHSGLQP